MIKHSKKNKTKVTTSKKNVNIIYIPPIRNYKIISTNNVPFMMKQRHKFVEIDSQPTFAKPMSIYEGTLVVYKQQAYIDLGFNSYIPVLNTHTGDILVSSI